jgi:hypothetical protein
MSSFPYEDSMKLFQKKFRKYKNIKIDVSGLKLGNEGIDHIISQIQNGVENLELSFNGVKTDNGFG